MDKFTKSKLSRMGLDRPPVEHKAEQEGDHYGVTSAKTSSSAELARGGHVKPHLGRSHRAKGGRAEHGDEPEDRSLVKQMVKPSALTGKSRGGRTHSEGHAHHDGRTHRAHGGRAKGKTVVNVIVAGNRGAPQAPVGAVPPPPPPIPSGGPSPAAPPMVNPAMAGAPMNPMPPIAGRPPMPPAGGLPPQLRAKGGRVADTSVKEKYGSGSGLGRLEKSRREGAHY